MLAFPLPQGHFYGPYKDNLQCHTGREDAREFMMLMEWQKHYSRVRDELPLSGLYDGPTQRAIIRFQHEKLIPATGHLDAETWSSLMAEVRTPPEPAPTPATVTAGSYTAPRRPRGRPKKTP